MKKILIFLSFLNIGVFAYGRIPHLRQKDISEIINNNIREAAVKDSILHVRIPTSSARVNKWFESNGLYPLSIKEHIKAWPEYGHIAEDWETDVYFLLNKYNLSDNRSAWIYANALYYDKVDGHSWSESLNILSKLADNDTEYAVSSLILLGKCHEKDQIGKAIDYYDRAATKGSEEAAYLAGMARNKSLSRIIDNSGVTITTLAGYAFATFVYYKVGKAIWEQMGKAWEWSKTEEGKAAMDKFYKDKASQKQYAESMLKLCVPELVRYNISGDNGTITLGTGKEIQVSRFGDKWIIDSRNILDKMAGVMIPAYGLLRECLETTYISPEEIANDCLIQEKKLYEKGL